MRKKIFTSLVFTLVFSIVFANVSFAAIGLDPNLHPEGAPTISGNLPEEEAGQTIDEQRLALTRRITNIVFGIASTVAVFFIVQNGWWLAASAGSEEKVTQAKKGLTWAAIGLLLIILSYSIIRFVITMPFQAHEESSVPGGQSAAPMQGNSNQPPADGSAPDSSTAPTSTDGLYVPKPTTEEDKAAMPVPSEGPYVPTSEPTHPYDPYEDDPDVEHLN